MYFMNRWEVESALDVTQDYPVRNRAARFLKAYMDEVDSHSDGWAYWRLPVSAAKKLMELVQGRVSDGTDATESQFRAAMGPIKSFYTRKGIAAGMAFPQI